MRATVTLWTEQSVTVDVEAPDDASDTDLRNLVLAQIDAGEVSFETVDEGTEIRRWGWVEIPESRTEREARHSAWLAEALDHPERTEPPAKPRLAVRPPAR